MQRLICASADLRDGGDAWRFELQTQGGLVSAFVLRWQGRVYAYVNQCAHLPVELDWNPGKVLDDAGAFLICAMHGALYAPDTGECVAGPCTGKRLQALAVCESNQQVFVEDGVNDE